MVSPETHPAQGHVVVKNRAGCRADGRVEELAGTAKAEMAPGDAFVVESPGGGGYGPLQAARRAAE